MKYIKKFIESNLGDDPKEFIQMVFDEDEFKEEFHRLQIVLFEKQENKWIFDIAGLRYDTGICIIPRERNSEFKYGEIYDYLEEKIEFLKENNIEVVYEIFTPPHSKKYEYRDRTFNEFINVSKLALPSIPSKIMRGQEPFIKNPDLYQVSLYFKQTSPN